MRRTPSVMLVAIIEVAHLTLAQETGNAATTSFSSSAAPLASSSSVSSCILFSASASGLMTSDDAGKFWSKTALVKAMSPGQTVIASVPEEDRGLFLIYHLAKWLRAYQSKNSDDLNLRINVNTWLSLEQSTEFKNIPIYDSFPDDLLRWITSRYGVTSLDVYSVFRRPMHMLCTTNGACFNPNDIGSLCCPF